MAQVHETIPESLAAEAEAARAWFSERQGSSFKLTGIVDPDQSLAKQATPSGRDLQLILCGLRNGQEVCLRERFQIHAEDGPEGFAVTHVTESDPEIGSPAPTLDPPMGTRRGWLDRIQAQHTFVVLIFYRGFW